MFIADLRRMIENCKNFNPPRNPFHSAALELERLLESIAGQQQ
jgi:hypothetical protein